MSLKLRLILSFCGVSMFSIILLATVLQVALHKDAIEAFTHTSEEHLTSEREEKKLNIEAQLDAMRQQIQFEASSLLTIDAAVEFTQAFNDHQVTTTNFSELEGFYNTQFKQQYNLLNKQSLNQNLFSAISDKARAFQHAYIASNTYPLGEKNSLIASNQIPQYDDIHAKYHNEFNQFLSVNGYYDVFIVSPDRGDIVYSVYKELDFATNLKTGPYSQSGIAQAYKKALKINKGEAAFVDFTPYTPSYESPASFISSPIFQGDNLVGILIYQFPIGRINDVMTSNKNWKKAGYGDSGEAYIVTKDKHLLTESRFYIEDPDAYIDLISKNNMQDIAKLVAAKSTTIGIQPVNSESVNRALAGESGFIEIIDYRNVPVFSSYTYINVDEDIRWALMSEMDVEESLKWVYVLEHSQLISTIFIALVLSSIAAIIATIIGRRLSSPIHSIADRFIDISTGDGDLTQRIGQQNFSELQQVGSSFNDFIAQIEGIVEQVQISSNSLNNLSERLSTSASKSSISTDSQKTSTFMVSSAMEEYNKSFLEVAQNTEAASHDASEAADEANNSAKTSREASAKINQLVENLGNSSDAVKQLESEVDAIKDVLSTITSIADQTNLLALNAAIEAARAGEQGRGFAVVADEVRTLAGRTQKTTIEIQQKMDELQKAAQYTANSILDSSTRAQQGSETLSSVAKNLDQLSVKVQNVQSRTDTIATATIEQLATSKEITQQLETINGISEDITTTAKDVAHAVEQINAISSGINILMERFKVTNSQGAK
ncbi:MAG: methyl-accepting chemotaxis protein [Oceanicoccus sp.]|jgi:methyl-accepting chemotaxis protein